MIFDPGSIADLLQIQSIAKELVGRIPAALVGGGVGALIGSVFGPLGLVIGALGGGALAHGAEQSTLQQIPTVKCPHPNCQVVYRYYSSNITSFFCPACRQGMAVASWG